MMTQEFTEHVSPAEPLSYIFSSHCPPSFEFTHFGGCPPRAVQVQSGSWCTSHPGAAHNVSVKEVMSRW